MSTQSLDKVLTHLDANLDKSLDRLFELLRIKSISTDPAFKADCRKAAEWLVEDLTSIGFDASVRDTPGHPMVVAHHEGATPDAPHVLFYGHYDVQPVDPLNLWENDPFDPAIKDTGNGRKILTGRGTSDDKGQLMTFVEACRAYKAVNGNLPVKVTLLFEGEEESGSPSLKPFLDANRQELKADVALVCDTSMWDPETPPSASACAVSSVRKLSSRQPTATCIRAFRRRGRQSDPYPHQNSGRPARRDRAHHRSRFLRRRGGNPDANPQIVGRAGPHGGKFPRPHRPVHSVRRKGRSVLELTWARPTAEVNGITGGYTGEGFKTVIAAEASAKVSFRLVHKQDPAKIREAFRTFVKERLPADCSVEFHPHGGSPAIQLPYDSPLVSKAKDALSDEWPKPAVLIAMGGSIPIVGDFDNFLGMESLLVGFGLEDDRIHSPNEKYELNSFHKGQRSWARIMAAIAAK